MDRDLGNIDGFLWNVSLSCCAHVVFTESDLHYIRIVAKCLTKVKCLTCSSDSIKGMVASLSLNIQWAAVTTYLEATRLPPQKCPDLMSSGEVMNKGQSNASIQGYLLT